MKPQTNESLRSKIKRTSAAFLGPVLAGLIGCLAFGARAAVQVTRFDPPLQILAYAEPSGGSFFCDLAADLDANDVVDFRLVYGYGEMSAFFNSPTRFAQRVSRPNVEATWGPLAGVPLGSTIGSNIVSSVATNFYAWSSGVTYRDDLTAPFGDYQTTVITANVGAFGTPQEPIVFINTNGTLFTNIFYPQPVISGDVPYKDAVMALEFYIDGQRHYGYIHFNFNNGVGGVIYGWAYETEPNTPIEAVSLAPPPAPLTNTPQLHSGIVGMVKEGNLSGWSVLISTANGTLVKSAETDGDGYFKADLRPGRYVLRPVHGPEVEPALATPNNSLVGAAKSVVVGRNHFTFVTLPTFGKASDLSKR